MLTRFFQLAFVTAVTTIPLTGCVVEDRDLDDAPPVITTPDVDDNEPEIDISAPGTDVEVDTVD